MTRFGIHPAALLLSFFAATGFCRAASESGTADFQEVYQLIKTHAEGLDDAALNRAAVEGMVSALNPRVQLVTGESAAAVGSALVPDRVNVLEDNVGYFRISRVQGSLAEELSKSYEQFAASNRLSGLVLDLRYADGTDYAAVSSVVSLFVGRSQPLLKSGDQTISSTDKRDPIQLPLVMLVNGLTSGSAEALAAVLRSSGSGLIIGSKTAGQALVVQDYRLKNGSVLRIAGAPVLLANGTPVSTNGIKPDIDVAVDPLEERAYYADAFSLVRKTNLVAGVDGSGRTSSGTNGNRRVRFGEAELVREHRAGLDRETGEAPRAREPEPDRPLVSDPALARALDLLKGLAVVRQSRS